MDQDHELWRTLRCAGKAQDKTSVDTLMLKYRPIAPKPTTTGQPLVGDTSSTRRTKRKYVRVSKNNKATCRSKTNGFRSSSTDPENGREDIVTLQLLPERSTPLSLDHNNLDPTVETINGDETCNTDTWLKFNGGDDALQQVPVETWVTVESVNSGLVSHAVGLTDEELTYALDKDTCPGFISDGSNRVVMVNEAYRRIVTGDGGFGREVIVWLVVDQTATFCDYRTFTCKVRMEYTWRETKYTKTLPCDVWKMEFGGFAWRLDTTAALTLWL
ncbi:unnamed protein product [Arabidopsis thaliana]|uniref:Emb/CAB62340.1 n=4 Tax=Arabidopsis TaxID=3701 RepID=Q9FKS6_ARATH|nr:uncharacterized protein AT5G40800 [Arabidopsis thaliana]KAG7611378.1 hypothetical protein ISN44_As05g034800 [Arabidopsis suecica]ABE65571.1 hypothetical protein At5g40800 [Arabidopsis thaliana]AED94596.1 hypothetical protein AT5G40800 [Arabidopsis thaliana]CAD5333605.1 unnamed protein product [Arabidopsis thaliana]VYS68867.1 unnamed protein product [Arabidopsis thaliana]|eukprot:NP_198896.1 hypothetical protein AT5G40800 [Arabidopsis thaliana]